MYQMVDMEYTDEEQLDYQAPIPLPDKPKYPYGLRICLTQKELDKLGLDPSCAFVGGIVHMHAMMRCTAVSSNETESGEDARVEFQIESLGVESEDQENKEADKAMGPSVLYDRKRM